ncbi:MAG: GNAT family N-acetyltransferase [Cyclobacteriaceae bacterium]|nr:MAG: GNAT family N-acetyltransferase [Cyclobacteriaceae bacterium]
MIRIEEARFDQIPAMRQVAIASYADTFADSNTPENLQAFFDSAYSLSQLEREFHEPDSRLYLALDETEVIGFVRMRKNNEVTAYLGENAIELQRLYVLTKAQGKSVGKLLMEKALEVAASNQFEWIWLGVWEKNYKAQQFYARWGFERFSEHTFWMGDDPQVDWLLKKKL